MKFLLVVALLIATSACSYDETLGRTDTVSPGIDAGNNPDAEPGTATCEGFVIPSGDCTLGHGACTFDSDCTGLNESCNGATGRCYLGSEVCVGTLCRLDGDCASGERCNLTSGTCFQLSASQRCMPCFLLSVDCGAQTCDTDLEICT
jgi:hypothetical protein